MLKKTLSILAISLLFIASTHSQEVKQVVSKYDPNELFNPLFYKEQGNQQRTGNGEPGKAYWQNAADYTIDAKLDDSLSQLSATVTLTYTNNSPHQLDFLWFQLDQNLFNTSSRGYLKLPSVGNSRYGSSKNKFDGGFEISTVKVINTVSGKSIETPIQPYITDTRMRLDLPKLLKSGGDKVKIQIDYKYIMPEYGADRSGVLNTPDGKIFAVAQWYPRICVFDDIQGWNTLPYLGAGEFYLEYGNFDVNLTVPTNHTVVASGELLNPSNVLTTSQLASYKKAISSDSTVVIRSKEDINNPASHLTSPTVTWKYKITNARDFAWASSASFIWDAAKINLPSGKKAISQSVYPAIVSSKDAWGRGN